MAEVEAEQTVWKRFYEKTQSDAAILPKTERTRLVNGD